jgi:asparagine synthase (glutamine-hydrolysing)
MNGIYNFKKNDFTCQNETVRLTGNVIICYKGNLFLDKENEQLMLAEIAKSSPRFNNLRDLSGQFAMVVMDGDSKSLYLIRDQFGVIPLYYSITEGSLIFGTTIESIIKESDQQQSVNEQVIHEYFMFRYISGDNTLFQTIYEVKPGSIIEINQKGAVNKRDYYEFRYSLDINGRDVQASTLFQNAFGKSLATQTRDKNEKTIGVLSSGGIDSSILVICAQKLLEPQFKTYYVGYEKYEHNRIAEVNYLSKICNTNQKNIFISNREFSDNLVKTIIINEEPLNHPSTVVRKCLFERIKGDVDILLSGEGADCFYCGYYIFSLMNYFYVKNALRPLSHLLAKLLPLNLAPRKYYAKLSKIKGAFTLQPDDYVIFNDILASNTKKDISLLLNAEFPVNFAENYTALFRDYSKQTILNIILYLYQTHYIIEALKTLTKIGDAYEIEHRHPFIDVNMINLFNTFPWNEKIKFFKRKNQIIELGKKHLPKEFFKKPKEGFGVPIAMWSYDEYGLGRFINLLNDKKTRERGIYNVTYLDDLLEQYHHKTLPADAFECIIWPIINYELWIRIFIDKDLKGYE